MCPREDCILEVKNGKVHCQIHDTYLRIMEDWKNSKFQVPMRHINYVAYSNGTDGEILIDEGAIKMYKIRHKEVGLYFSNGGHRFRTLLGWSRSYNDKSFLSKYGKVWSTENGVQETFRFLNKIYPDVFEIVKFVEE